MTEQNLEMTRKARNNFAFLFVVLHFDIYILN
jgi:hypothetical protein